MRLRSVSAAAVLLFVALIALSTRAAEPAPGKGAIKGVAVYGIPVAKITITLTGPTKTTPATTNDKGEFSFENLSPGQYTVDAKGIAKNAYRKATVTVTIADPPKEPAPLKLKLQ